MYSPRVAFRLCGTHYNGLPSDIKESLLKRVDSIYRKHPTGEVQQSKPPKSPKHRKVFLQSAPERTTVPWGASALA